MKKIKNETIIDRQEDLSGKKIQGTLETILGFRYKKTDGFYAKSFTEDLIKNRFAQRKVKSLKKGAYFIGLYYQAKHVSGDIYRARYITGNNNLKPLSTEF